MSDRSVIEKRVVFVGGAPRSGTTLVQNILDSHPSVLGGPEFLHLPDIIELRSKLLVSVDKKWIDLICSREDIDRHITNLIAGLLLPFADRHDAVLLSEKTPENVLVFPQLLELLPNAKFIHVVRNPLATVASLLAVGERARQVGERPKPYTDNTTAAIKHVRCCLESGFRAARQAPDRVFTLVYEHLVAQPERVGRELCGFLGIEWHPAMATPGKQEHLGEGALTYNSQEIWYDTKTYYSNPNTHSLEKWRFQLSATDQLLISRGFVAHARALARLGIDLAPSHLGAGSRLKGRLGLLGLQVRHGISGMLRKLAGSEDVNPYEAHFTEH